jgi:hypothetical protein
LGREGTLSLKKIPFLGPFLVWIVDWLRLSTMRRDLISEIEALKLRNSVLEQGTRELQSIHEQIDGLESRLDVIHSRLTSSEEFLAESLHQSLVAARAARCPRSLAPFEATAFSQSGEDGIIAEIFRRIGWTNRFFVEFGTADGLENNTALLLLTGWAGLWLDNRDLHIETIHRTFSEYVRNGRLTARLASVNPSNIEELFREAGVPREFDLLSIDIDRNDYWVWQAIRHHSPRVVVIEYNSIFPPSVEWVVDNEPELIWDGTSHFGASLKALENLGRNKGYSLVGCNLAGVNAFFVRSDLLGEAFFPDYSAEFHYEPPRYRLALLKRGHPRRIGPPGNAR